MAEPGGSSPNTPPICVVGTRKWHGENGRASTVLDMPVQPRAERSRRMSVPWSRLQDTTRPVDREVRFTAEVSSGFGNLKRRNPESPLSGGQVRAARNGQRGVAPQPLDRGYDQYEEDKCLAGR